MSAMVFAQRAAHCLDNSLDSFDSRPCRFARWVGPNVMMFGAAWEESETRIEQRTIRNRMTDDGIAM